MHTGVGGGYHHVDADVVEYAQALLAFAGQAPVVQTAGGIHQQHAARKGSSAERILPVAFVAQFQNDPRCAKGEEHPAQVGEGVETFLAGASFDGVHAAKLDKNTACCQPRPVIFMRPPRLAPCHCPVSLPRAPLRSPPPQRPFSLFIYNKEAARYIIRKQQGVSSPSLLAGAVTNCKASPWVLLLSVTPALHFVRFEA